MRNSGFEKHAKVVANMMLQGKKFNKTMRYGFPLVSRKTVQTSEQIINEVQGRNSMVPPLPV